ncbi:MAG: V-type ATP synthase subunit I [Methanocellales archaeon]|nr:V-type ATP synthase subunit I [Methanocellales archaeon]
MFFPAEMKNVTIVTHDDYRERVISALHEAGVMEITNVQDSKGEVSATLEPGESHPLTGKCAEYELRVSRVLDALKGFQESKESLLKQFLFPEPVAKTSVEERAPNQLFDEVESVLEKAGRAISIQDELASIDEKIGTLQAQRVPLKLLEPFDFDLRHLGESKYLYIVAGTVRVGDYELFVQTLFTIEDILLLKRRIGELYTVVIAVPASAREELDDILRGRIFSAIKVEHPEGKASQLLGQIDDEIKKLEGRKKELSKELKIVHDKWNKKLLTLREELKIEKERMELPSKFGKTVNTSVIEGWVPAKNVDELKKLCDNASDGHAFYESREPEAAPEEIPIKYANPSWLRPFETLTKMFGHPKYGEVDPTIFFGTTLVAFFGLMLGDAIYGLIIVLVGFLLYRGAGKVSESMHDMSIILMAIGASTIVLGAIQGSYCGDVFPRFWGMNSPFMLIDPLREPKKVLFIALVIGIVHLNVGLLLAAYQNARKKAYRNLLGEQISMFIIQPCAAILILDFFKWAAIAPSLKIVGGVGILIGVILIALKEGPLGVFGFTGFVGNWLSYARILALALATSGIAMTVNIFVELVARIHPAMVILAAFIFVFGQIFNCVLQALGAFVHSLRLHYVEFFNQFYSGDGKYFIPFKSIRRYTKLKT